MKSVEQEKSGEPKSPSASSPGKVNILLVDDEERNLDVLESILVSPEYHLVRVQTPDDALLALMHNEFACIVLDIQMPTMSGIDLAQLIKTRKRNKHIPIIFLTAYFQNEIDVLQGYHAGAVDYLTKPLNPDILRSKVRVFVDMFLTARALALANLELQQEVAQRKNAEEALREVNLELEMRVQERVQELKRANDELQAASRAKDDFLAMLSHELRTPLNPVLLIASDAVNNHELPPRVRADFAMISKNVDLEARLIDDLLDLTRITRGKIILDKQYLNVRRVLEDALSNVQQDLTRKRISLDLKLCTEEHSAFADAVRMQQIFSNLLKNAVKFTPEEGRITVESSVDDAKLIVKIIDTGIGMVPEELANIFTAFSQGNHADKTNSHRFGGLGLGLAISQRLAEFHSGRIHAASEGRNRGATFTVELPLAAAAEIKESAPARPAESPPAPPVKAGNIRVLLVEDHEPTRAALTHLLMRRSYKVTTAGSMAEARALVDSQEFNLLISDIGLPDGNGYDLMAEFKKQFDLPGIALTGYGMEQDVALSQKAGFAVHLTKPVRMESLDTALATVLNQNLKQPR